MKPPRFSAAALRELEDAAEMYTRDDPAVGLAFRQAVKAAAEAAAANPAGFPKSGRRGIRKVILIRFPYSVVFLETAAVIRIVAVAHHKRRPGYWANRLTP